MKSKITIVTVTYNAANVIENTILSVVSQTYKSIEYIIIDGGSNDETSSIIEKYNNYIKYYISEPDNGIYDAMNKAVDISTGEWILFLNSGDIFVDENVLSKIFDVNEDLSRDQVIYGDTLLKYPWGIHRNVGRLFSKNDICLPFCHQSVFVRTELMKKYKFDLSYKIVADYNFFYKLYLSGAKFNHVDILISIYDMEGFSSRKVKESYEEIARINGTYGTAQYYKKKIYLSIRKVIFILLPSSLIEKIRKVKRILD